MPTAESLKPLLNLFRYQDYLAKSWLYQLNMFVESFFILIDGCPLT
jgi:hypothetical protein